MSKRESIHIENSHIQGVLKQESVEGKRLLEPLKEFAKINGVPFNILEDKNVDNDAEVHMHEADLWHCLEGEVTFICGGQLVNGKAKVNKDGSLDEREWKAKEIKGGREMILSPGDWLFIPAGEPHKHSAKGVA
ncbi:MAG TPA: hypothetical protein VI981_02095 [Candidatus Paceibacterota bacterium]